MQYKKGALFYEKNPGPFSTGPGFLLIICTKNYIINKDLQYKIKNNIKFKSLINTYRGFRLKNKLPSHGQNTHSNGKTAKKIMYTI